MNNYDFEQLILSARQASLADYFLQSGYTTERFGAEVYVKEFPGLCVNQNTNYWYSHYDGVGSKTNAIDCLVNICKHNFKQAVLELTGQDVGCVSNRSANTYVKKDVQNRTQKEPAKKELQMPERDENMRRIFAYFCKERKIPAEIIEEFIHAKLLYQSQEEIKTTVNDTPQTFRKCNAVFVHRDENGEATGGEVQGVNSFKRYKGIVAGTGESVFSYTPHPAEDCKIKTAYLFESAVDLMSFYAFCKPEKMQGVTLISMAGLKPTVPKQLQERGVKIYSCVDNDEKGRKFERDNKFKRGTDMLEKADVKDWNQLLALKIEQPEAVKDFVPEIERNTNIKKQFGGRKLK